VCMRVCEGAGGGQWVETREGVKESAREGGGG
jgi:hypothetical protein